MKNTELKEPRQTENENPQKGSSSISTQRLMFVGYWEWDLKTGEYSWCDEMYRIFNLSPQQTLRPGTFFNSVHPEDRAMVVKALGKALAGEQSYFLNHRIVWPDGSVRSVNGKAEVTFDGGKPIRVFGIIQDITDNLQIKEI